MIKINTPHIRKNLLTGKNILVSPQRMQRPWQGQKEKTERDQLPAYDPQCYLCPGNQRAQGQKNPHYAHTFVFDNDFPALLPHKNSSRNTTSHLDFFQAKPEYGICRVVCYSPIHNKTMADMTLAEIQHVIKTWITEYQNLGSDPKINHVEIFENKSTMMGCSNPHPHGQIWAQETLPDKPAQEQTQQLDYWRKKSTPLLVDYLSVEKSAQERIVAQNTNWVVLVPFWAAWPYETMIIPTTHVLAMNCLNKNQIGDLASILSVLTQKYDQLFSCSFPYSMGWHQRPTDGNEYPEWQLHAHFYPPLLRSATVRKFMVGYEMLAMPQRDITAESAAEILRQL